MLGGWNVAGIVSWHTGFPITVTANDVSLQNPRGTARPNRIGNGTPADQTIDHWLDETAFVMPPQGSLAMPASGSSARRSTATWMSPSARSSRCPAVGTGLPPEFFNFLNHPSFSPPAVNFSTPNTFGRITGTVSQSRNLEFALKFHF